MKRLHNNRWRLAVLTILFGFSTLATGAGQNRPSGMLPVQLDLLFSTLPDKVDDWELTKSKGWRGHYLWMESIVVREFEAVSEGADGTQVSRKVKLSLKDTAKFAQSDIQLFENFVPDKGGAVERFFVKSVSAIVSEKEDTVVAQFLLQERFVLNITFYNVPKSELGKWFRLADQQKLSSVKDGAIVKLPQNVFDQSIDQLKGMKKGFVLSMGDVEEAEEGEEAEVSQ